MKKSIVSALLAFLTFAPSVRAAVNGDVGRQLFVDDTLVETTDLKRVWHHPVKYAGNPVMKPETPWEINAGGNATVRPNGGGLWWDEEEGVFKLWYEAGWLHTVCYATSPDGIRWTRPSLDLYPGTNIVLPTNNPCYRPDSWSVVKDPHCADPSVRYKLMLHRPWTEPRQAPDGVCAVSPDGIRWREVSKLPPCGDRSSLYYDPFREKWVFSLRSSWGRGDRNRARWETADFMSGPGWTGDDWSARAQPWLAAEERDAVDPAVAPTNAFPRTQLYNFDAVAYESVMVGLFEILLGPENGECEKKGLPKITDIKFGFSRDGRKFVREDYGAAIASERWGSGKWDTGYVQPLANGFVIVGDELRFYYGAFRGEPSRANTATRKYGWTVDNGMYANGAMGMAVLRRDGFASLEGTGSVLTKPLHFSGEYLFVNADAGHGAVAAELVGPDGRVVEGYGAADSRIERTDSCKARIVWKTHDRVSVPKWKGHRLRFVLEDAALYAFWLAMTPNGESNGYLAGGGPGYASLRDVPKVVRPETPPAVMAPDAAHAPATRTFSGIPSVAVSPKGRMWATWYAGSGGWEDETNYLVLSSSADDGQTWEERLVCDPDGPQGPRRVFDPELWLAPDGLLRWTWTDRVNEGDALPDWDQLWMATLDPETGKMVEAPRVIASGVMMCKPIVARDGAWLFPVAEWRRNPSACCYASTDGGRTFIRRGGVRIPPEERLYDEHSFIEKGDGTLKCYVRTRGLNGGNALWSAESADGGRTWSEASPDPLAHLSARVSMTRLRNGHWLAVKNGGWRKVLPKRTSLVALISRDEGQTWDGPLLLDGRTGCAYPDAQELEDGSIVVVSDFDRARRREISFVRFTEADVLGYASSPKRRTISREVR